MSATIITLTLERRPAELVSQGLITAFSCFTGKREVHFFVFRRVSAGLMEQMIVCHRH